MVTVARPKPLTKTALDQEWQTHRAALHFHCYQMLGSIADAEDLVQDTYGRAIDAAPRFEGRSTIKTWLFKIATFACIDELRRRKRRRLLSVRKPNGREDETLETVELENWIEPYPDAMVPDRKYADLEAVTLAFVAALQFLTPRQRAILVLRDTLDWSAAQVAELLGMTVAATHATLLRARAVMASKSARQPHNRKTEDLAAARAFALAFERRDIAAITAMLQKDVEVHMPPFELWLRGRDVYLEFMERRLLAGRDLRTTVTRANGKLAVAMVDHASKKPFAIVILDRLVRGKVARIHAFVMPHIVPFFLGA